MVVSVTPVVSGGSSSIMSVAYPVAMLLNWIVLAAPELPTAAWAWLLLPALAGMFPGGVCAFTCRVQPVAGVKVFLLSGTP